MVTRRTFGKLALASLPLARAFGKIDSKIAGVQLGTQSYQFRGLVARRCHKSHGRRWPRRLQISARLTWEGGFIRIKRPRLPPAGTAAQGRPIRRAPPPGKREREELRKWRLSVSLDYFKGIKKKFNNAGINLYGYNYSFNRWSFTERRNRSRLRHGESAWREDPHRISPLFP